MWSTLESTKIYIRMHARRGRQRERERKTHIDNCKTHNVITHIGFSFSRLGFDFAEGSIHLTKPNIMKLSNGEQRKKKLFCGYHCICFTAWLQTRTYVYCTYIYIYLYIVIFDCGQRFFLLVIASACRIGKPANILHIASCYKNASS